MHARSLSIALLCLAAGLAASLVTAASPPGSPADHFVSYKTRPDRSGPAFTPVTRLPVADVLGSRRVDVAGPDDLLVPSSAGGGTVTDPATQLRAYKIKPSSGEPRFVKQTAIAVGNELGTIRVDLKKQAFVLLPGALGTGNVPAPPGTSAVDRYACYTAALASGEPRFPRDVHVVVDNQLGEPSVVLDLLKPAHLCLPADVQSQGIKNRSGALLCYQARRSKGRCSAGAPANALGACTAESECGGTKGQTSFCVAQPKPVAQLGLGVTTELGGLLLATVKESALCIPSVASVLPAPTASPTPVPSPAVCGDGVVQGTNSPPEQCDPPGSIGACAGGVACDDACQCPEPSACGNGRVDAGEACDGVAGSCPSGATCGNACACIAVAACGDGDVDPGEDCDPPGDEAACNGLGCLGGCRCPIPPPIRIAGRVVAVGGVGLAGVIVQVGRTPLEVVTDADGHFAIGVGESEVQDGDILVRANLEGYSQGFERLRARAGDTAQQIQLTLQPAALAMSIPDAAVGIDAATPEVRLTIAPDALPTDNPVALEIMPLDPTGEQRAAFPGTDFLAAQPATAANGGSGVVPLESVVLVDVRITDLVTGERLSNLGLPATVELRLPTAQQGLAVGATIPWWSFDEGTARWIEGGLAEVVLGADGAKWMRAEARHFSWWNVDYPVATHSCMRFRLLSGAAVPIDLTAKLNAQVESADGVGWAAEMRFSGFAAADGRVCATMKRSESPADTLRIRVNAGGTRYLGAPVGGRYPLVADAAQAFAFTTPSVQASCTWNVATESCADLGDLVLAESENLRPVVLLPLGGGSACATSELVLSVLASDTDGDLPLTVDWSASFGQIVPASHTDGATTIDTVRWTFPGGPAPPTPPTATVTVTDARGGTVTRTVTADYQANCCPVVQTLTAPVYVDPRQTPIVDLLAVASDADGPGPLTYDWTIAGDRLSGAAVQWGVRSNGVVQARVAVSDGVCTRTRSVPIQIVNRAPTVRLDQPASIACDDPSATIVATITEPDGDPVDVTWSTSNDGASVTPAGPVHLAVAAQSEVTTSTAWSDADLQAGGTRDVKVVVTDAFGARAEARRYFDIDRQSLRISALVAPSAVAPGSTVQLEAVMDGNLATPSTFDWTADDGVIAPSGALAQWTAPASAGRYVVTVRAANACAADERWVAIDVDPTLPIPGGPDSCAAELTVTPASGTSPLPVDLSVTTANAFPNASYTWSFGDGATQFTSEPHTSHVYSFASTLAPSVTVTSVVSAGGQTRTRTCSADSSVTVAGGALGTWTFGVATGNTALCPGTSLSDGSQIRASGAPGSNSTGGGSVCTLTRGNFAVDTPFQLTGGAPDENGIASIALTGARVVSVKQPTASSDNWICLRVEGSTPGWVDCNGGSDARVETTVNSQTTFPPPDPAWDDSWLTMPTGQDSGPGAAQLPVKLQVKGLVDGVAGQCPAVDDPIWPTLTTYNTAFTTGQATSRIHSPRRCPNTVVIYNCPTAATFQVTMPAGGNLSCGGWSSQANALWKAPFPVFDADFGGGNFGDMAIVVRLRSAVVP